MPPQITTSRRTDKPLIPVTMISHGTLSSIDLQASRRFYEEVLGFEVVQLSPVTMLLRRGTDHTYVVVETGEPGHMQLLDHNGLDVPTREDVDESHRLLHEIKAEYGIGRITKLLEQHGVYSFYFQDLDHNWWEITSARPNGYSYVYDDPARDITGRTDVDIDAMQHVFDDEYAERLRQTAAG
ncbi:VOC family protein [Streptomyces sp. NPDC091217]|uniref:VOC family protein n=1 Tax=Streptomyces sp. NPDC091217 TaxID=3365975 RepID=UPI0038303789